MKKFKKLMLVGMMALVLIGVQATSHALTLGFWDFNGHFVLVADGGLNDSSGGSTPDGIVTYSGSVGDNWSVNVTTGMSKPLIGSAEMPQIDLSSVNLTSVGAGRLRFGIVDSGFTGAGPYTFLAGGVTQGQISFAIFGQENGAEDFTGHIMNTSSDLIFGSLGPFSVPPNPLAFSGSTLVDPLNADSPFSLGIIADISHSDKGLITSFNGNLTPVPEPMSLILLGCGLIAVIGVGRKFRK